jgi:ParB-like chromosome segregation protein Spo0J
MNVAAVQTLSLHQITLDGRAWPREALDEERVELFAELVRDVYEHAARTQTGWKDPLPPIVVVADGRGGYVLADGRHRHEARRRLGAGFDRVQANVFEPNGRLPIDHAYELALLCTIGAKPLTQAEKDGAIARLIAERHDLSDRAIARLVGVSPTTVGKRRAGLSNLDTQQNARAGAGSQRISERVIPVNGLLAHGEKLLHSSGLDATSARQRIEQELAAAIQTRDPEQAAAWADWWAGRFAGARELLERTAKAS